MSNKFLIKEKDLSQNIMKTSCDRSPNSNAKNPKELSYKFQISLLYSSIVRSDEKKPAIAMFTIIFFAHAVLSS